MRNYWDARYVSAYYDVSPKAFDVIGRILRLDDNVIRFHVIKVPSAIDKCDSVRYNNPYFDLLKPRHTYNKDTSNFHIDKIE